MPTSKSTIHGCGPKGIDFWEVPSRHRASGTGPGAGRQGWAGIAIALAIAGVVLVQGPSAGAVSVPMVPLGTSASYSVLGAETVTNTGDSVLYQSLGVWPGTSITGFPPGVVNAPGVIETTTAAAQQAQLDASNGYDNAAGRSVDLTTTAELAGLVLAPGVYSGPSKSALLLSGPLILDGEGDKTSVFIFQTDSTLTTAAGSSVQLINGAQQCSVFWQIGSSATLGTGSVFVGTILARASVTVNDSVTVHGRVVALTGAVTLQNDSFTAPTCDRDNSTGTTPTTPGGGTTPGATQSPTPAGSGLRGNPTDIPTTGPAFTRKLSILAWAFVAAGFAALFVARPRKTC